MTMVDNAHGEGVVGRGGRGIVDHFGLHGKFDVEIGTFSRLLVLVGGIVAGKKVIVVPTPEKPDPAVLQRCHGSRFSCVSSSRQGPRSHHTDLVDRLWREYRDVQKSEMHALGFDIGSSVTNPPVMLGDVKLAKAFSRRLFEEGVFAMAAPDSQRYPLASPGSGDGLGRVDTGRPGFRPAGVSKKVGKELGTIS